MEREENTYIKRNISLPREVEARGKLLAERHGRSFSNLLRWLLEEAIRREERAPEETPGR